MTSIMYSGMPMAKYRHGLVHRMLGSVLRRMARNKPVNCVAQPSKTTEEGEAEAARASSSARDAEGCTGLHRVAVP